MRDLTAGLAVCTPVLGHASETFVARHAHDLAPGRTLTVATSMATPMAWTADPHLVLAGRPQPSPIRRRVDRVAARLRGDAPGDWRWAPTERDLAELDAALDRHGVTVVLTEFLDTWVPLLPWLRRRGLRVVAHSHGRDVSVRLRDPWWRERYLAYNDVDAVIVVSEVVRDRLTALGIDRNLVHVIPCGVDVEGDVPARPRRENDGEVHVLAVGRLVEKKNPLATIEAFAAAAGIDDRLRLTLVGDGPLAGAVAARVAATLVSDRVRLVGRQPHDQVARLMRSADLFVQHSVVASDGDEEGLPVAVLEAMAAGLPVVATRHAGIPEAVGDGVTGLLVDEGDWRSMATAIVELAADPGRRHRLGAAGHAVARDRFSWQRERRDLRRVLGVTDEVGGSDR